MEEMQDDVCDAISNALDASGKKFYIIKAMTGAGHQASPCPYLADTGGW